jgi:hypothetical protein
MASRESTTKSGQMGQKNMQHDSHLTNSNYYTSRIHRSPDHRAIHNQTYTPLPLQTQTTFGKSPTTRLATTRCRSRSRGNRQQPSNPQKQRNTSASGSTRQAPQFHNTPEEDACKGSRKSRGTPRHSMWSYSYSQSIYAYTKPSRRLPSES